MPHLDPTYLRYIYDGLIKGSIHPENESELPEGLIGLYEESFEENTPIMHRQKLLKRFVLFALLKKEVSISFVAEVLEESENDILEFINTYASWFNSPESGKYQLYHERLKVYILTKSSGNVLLEIIEKLVHFLLNNNFTKEIESHKHEFLGVYIEGQLLCKNFDFEKAQKVLFNNSFIECQFELNPSGDWFFNNLKNALNYSDFTKYKKNKLLYSVWINSFNRIKKTKTLAFKEFINEGKTEILTKLFQSYSDYLILYEELIYAIKALVKSDKLNIIGPIGNEIISFFPNDKTMFTWNKLSDLNENLLLNMCYELFSSDIDYSFISNYGIFNIENLKEMYNELNKGLRSLSFLSSLVKNNSIKDQSYFYVYSNLSADEKNDFDKCYSEFIIEPLYELKYLLVKNNYNQELIFDEQKESYNKITPLEKNEVLFHLYSNLENIIIKRDLNLIETKFIEVCDDLLELDTEKFLTDEEALLELDHKLKRFIFIQATCALIIARVNTNLGIEKIELLIEKSNEIKNGGVKGEALSQIQKTISGFNETFYRLGEKADSKIPRVPLGGLSYGQYEADNFLDLSENNWTLNKKNRAYKLLLDAEKKVNFIEEQSYKDQVSLRMLNLFLNHNKHLKARNIFKNITMQQVRLLALRSICNFYIENDSKRIKGLLKDCTVNNEKQIIIKLILNHLDDITFKEYKELFFKYISSYEESNVFNTKHKISTNSQYKLTQILLDKNKTYPPFCTLLYSNEKLKNKEELMNQLNPFQRLYFSNKIDLLNNALSLKDKKINIGNSNLRRLIDVVKNDDYQLFTKEDFISLNKFKLLQLIKVIIEHTKKPYLFIDFLSLNVDEKMFYTCFESMVFNNKILNRMTTLDSFNNYQYTKILRSEKIAKLMLLKK